MCDDVTKKKQCTPLWRQGWVPLPLVFFILSNVIHCSGAQSHKSQTSWWQRRIVPGRPSRTLCFRGASPVVRSTFEVNWLVMWSIDGPTTTLREDWKWKWPKMWVRCWVDLEIVPLMIQTGRACLFRESVNSSKTQFKGMCWRKSRCMCL